MKDPLKEVVCELEKGEETRTPRVPRTVSKTKGRGQCWACSFPGIMKDAARRQGRGQAMQVLGCAREYGYYRLVGKEKALEEREMTKLVLCFEEKLAETRDRKSS